MRNNPKENVKKQPSYVFGETMSEKQLVSATRIKLPLVPGDKWFCPFACAGSWAEEGTRISLWREGKACPTPPDGAQCDSRVARNPERCRRGFGSLLGRGVKCGFEVELTRGFAKLSCCGGGIGGIGRRFHGGTNG